MKTKLQNTVTDLWHLSKTALSGKDCSRYDRMIYVKNELLRTYPHLVGDLKGKQLWFFIGDNTQVYGN